MRHKNLFTVFGITLALSACATSTEHAEKPVSANKSVKHEAWDCASLLEDPSRKMNECSHKDVIEYLLNKSMKSGERAVLLNPDEIAFSVQHSIDMRLINSAHAKDCSQSNECAYQAEFFTYTQLTTPVEVTLPVRIFVWYKIKPTV